eukprot:c1913_g2_i1.p1 GENE.c1913_g2_i1~~c1913_g2_i1.p1  ORF type:complete len:106 (-),score=39.34 c1913_g2_i1:188-472(-)
MNTNTVTSSTNNSNNTSTSKRIGEISAFHKHCGQCVLDSAHQAQDPPVQIGRKRAANSSHICCDKLNNTKNNTDDNKFGSSKHSSVCGSVSPVY